MTERDEIDHEWTREMVCPYCGREQRDLGEISGARDDQTIIEVYCRACDQPFNSVCEVSYTFTTSKIDRGER